MRNVQVLVSGVERFDAWVQVLACLGEMGVFQCEHMNLEHNTRQVILKTAYSDQTLGRVLAQHVPKNVPFAVREQHEEECHDCREMAA